MTHIQIAGATVSQRQTHLLHLLLCNERNAKVVAITDTCKGVGGTHSQPALAVKLVGDGYTRRKQFVLLNAQVFAIIQGACNAVLHFNCATDQRTKNDW